MKKYFRTSYTTITILGMILWLSSGNYVQAQKDQLKKYTDQFSNLKEKSREFKISGNLSLGSKYRFALNSGKRFEYNAQANVNISYFGISIPLSYRLTSGRSIIGLNSPNINIPKFQDFGISPNYKHYTLHLGTRQMQFTPYTYQGIRFKGVGVEILPEKGVFAKIFKGRLRSPFEEFINITSNQTISQVRRGFGVQTGYKTENNQYALSVFKAQDDSELPMDSTLLKPKENAVVSLMFRQNLFSSFSLHFERSISAFTNDTRSQRVNIATHTTGYNMLGLFTKREGSTYTNAMKAGLDYKIQEAMLGLKYEEVDRGYKTLGTIFLDNDFRTYSFTFSVPVDTKLFLNGELGIRNQGISAASESKDNNFIGMLNANYQFSERVNSTLMVSNLRSTQSSFASVNGLLVDSLRLTLSNKLVSTTTNVILGEEKDANFSFLASYMQSTQIQEDSLSLSSQVHTTTFNLAYSKRYEKLTSNYMLLYTRNITEFQSNNIIGFTTSHTYKWDEKLESKHSWNSNIAINSSKTFINLMSNTISYISDFNLEASLTHRLLINARDEIEIKDHFVEVECRYKF